MCFSEIHNVETSLCGVIIPSNKTLNAIIYIEEVLYRCFFHRRVYGNMMGDAEDDSGSLDSDSDLILDGDGGAAGAGASGGIMDSDDEDDDDELEVSIKRIFIILFL